MIIKNLVRRKGRTSLTVLGISIGVAAIIGLGTLAEGFEAGYSSMLSGSQADLVLSQPDTFDISYSAVDESVGPELEQMSEVAATSGMLQGFVQTGDVPFFFVFGYREDSFVLDRFQIIEGVGLYDRTALSGRGKAVLLGGSAAEALNKQAGDALRLGDSVYRIVGIYQTGDAFEDGGAVLDLADAQELVGKPRQVSLFYIQLKDPALRDRLEVKVERRWPELSLTGTDDFADKQFLGDALKGYVWVIAGLAIVIGGVGMMNAQLMSVMERTREIGVLRAVGWSSFRILRSILAESILVSLIGGIVGVGLGWLLLNAFSDVASFFGANASMLRPALLQQAFVVVLALGMLGGLYPAWRAARLQPIDALRYEGGTSGQRARRLPVGGMAVQSLWQRSSRTFLTLSAIALTVGAIMALEGWIRGAADMVGDLALGANVEIMIRQADIADTSLSAIDERVGDRIGALPEVASVSGMIMSAVLLPDSGGFFIMWGYAPNEYAIRRFNVVEGQPLSSNHQILLGRLMADSMRKGVGDTVDLSGSRFKVAGIYETGVPWEELGGVVTLRDAQTFAGRPRKVTMYAVKVQDPAQAPAVVDAINQRFPEAHAALAGEFAEQMPDMQNADGMLSGISVLAIVVGGVGVLNTMLMAVLERTREIGVLRALGWRRRRVMAMILREALALGLLGGGLGIGLAFALNYLLSLAPLVGDAVTAVWAWDIFVRAIGVALLLGLIGGIYPAFRATRMQPTEALRYE